MMRLLSKIWLLGSIMVYSQVGITQENAVAASVLSCEYECKILSNFTLREASTVLIANENQDLGGQHTVTHRAHLVFLDGNENPIIRSYVDLSGNDLDEVSVCHSVTDHLRGGSVFSQAVPPAAGLVKIIVEEANPAFVNPASPDLSAFQPGTGIVAWTRSAIGSFKLGQIFSQTPLQFEPDLFGDANSPADTARTLCNQDKAFTTNANDTLSSLLSAPYVAPAGALAVVGDTLE